MGAAGGIGLAVCLAQARRPGLFSRACARLIAIAVAPPASEAPPIVVTLAASAPVSVAPAIDRESAISAPSVSVSSISVPSSSAPPVSPISWRGDFSAGCGRLIREDGVSATERAGDGRIAACQGRRCGTRHARLPRCLRSPVSVANRFQKAKPAASRPPGAAAAASGSSIRQRTYGTVAQPRASIRQSTTLLRPASRCRRDVVGGVGTTVCRIGSAERELCGPDVKSHRTRAS